MNTEHQNPGRAARPGSRWARDGDTWYSQVYPGWSVRDTGRRGRARYVIIDPSGTVIDNWHLAHMDKKKPGLNHAQWSAEARAERSKT